MVDPGVSRPRRDACCCVDHFQGASRMNRLYLAACCVSSALAFGCGPKEFGSVCTEVPAPEACMTACDPAPGAANACPAGFHCTGDGKCDAQCSVGGGQCGDG